MKSTKSMVNYFECWRWKCGPKWSTVPGISQVGAARHFGLSWSPRTPHRSSWYSMIMFSIWICAVLATAHGDECVHDTPEDVPQFLQKSLQLQEDTRMNTENSKMKVRAKRKEGEIQTHHFYANFHGLDPALATLMNIMHDSSVACGSCGIFLFSCEEEGLTDAKCKLRNMSTCSTSPTSCSADNGLRVLGTGIIGQNFSSVNTTDFTSLKNLWADRRRYELLASSMLTQSWLPAKWGPTQRVLITTILMDPVERLRSVFYISSEDHSPEAFTAYLEAQYELSNSTGDTGMPLGKGCCEYNYYLGSGDVKTAKKVLVSQFDLVGISEMMSQTLVCLARLYGKTAAGMGTLARDSGLQVPKTEKWKKDDLDMATAITAKDQKIYDFAKELFQRQSVSMWNNNDVLKAQTKNLEEAWNKKWEPEWDSVCAVVEPLAETHVDGDSERCQLDMFVHDQHGICNYFQCT